MHDLIRRSELRKRTIDFRESLKKSGELVLPSGFGAFLDFIAEAPAVDAVEVLRCRDCKHWKPSGSKAGNSFSDMEYIGGCEFTNYCRRESDYCSYGERKE